ncbi:hypothetical protein BaRGS_00026635 [Batillaria attramentaria]|uniref:Uncharacterized protein n=1 Tax=Batillaria attramentaria TaxID=370345 RepID=A0ABD0K5H4_9CAEN
MAASGNGNSASDSEEEITLPLCQYEETTPKQLVSSDVTPNVHVSGDEETEQRHEEMQATGPLSVHVRHQSGGGIYAGHQVDVRHIHKHRTRIDHVTQYQADVTQHHYHVADIPLGRASRDGHDSSYQAIINSLPNRFPGIESKYHPSFISCAVNPLPIKTASAERLYRAHYKRGDSLINKHMSH